MRAIATLAVLLFVGAFLAPIAGAQDAGAEARSHFERGVALYDEGRLAQALVEFREARRIQSSSVILYNVAQVEAELGHAVEAVDAYEELVRTARTIEPGMRARIDAALATQRGRIATLDVEANVNGALVALDDVDIGAVPLAGARISSGEHVLTLRASGFESVRYRFTVAGGAEHHARITLTASDAALGSLRVDARVPGIDVVIDGVSYGLTPLAGGVPLATGSHHVEGRRAAYTLFAQDVTVAPASETRVSIVVEPDPAAPASELGTLRLAVPTASSSVRIDGVAAEAASLDALALPAGLHDVEVHAADREAYTTRVDLLAQETYDLRPRYLWTPEARESRIADAHLRRDLGWGFVIGGAVLGVGGVIAIGVNQADWESGSAGLSRVFSPTGACFNADHNWAMVQGSCPPALEAMGVQVGPSQGGLEPRAVTDARERLASSVSQYNTLMAVAGTIAGVGGAMLAVGLALVLTAPSDADVDRAARAHAFRLELAAGPGSLVLRGAF
ncbi:MAG: PEGA domain-containing protein [Sandaracinus sp.]